MALEVHGPVMGYDFCDLSDNDRTCRTCSHVVLSAGGKLLKSLRIFLSMSRIGVYSPTKDAIFNPILV